MPSPFFLIQEDQRLHHCQDMNTKIAKALEVYITGISIQNFLPIPWQYRGAKNDTKNGQKLILLK